MENQKTLETLYPSGLINEVLGALAQPKKSLYRYVGQNKLNEFHLRKAQRELVKSTKYFINDNLLSHAVNASWVTPDKLLEAMKRAMSPSNNMWIEWDENVRKRFVKTCTNKNCPDLYYEPDFESPNVGYHITRRSDDPFGLDYLEADTIKIGIPNFDRIEFEGFIKDQDGKILPMPIGFRLFFEPLDPSVFVMQQDSDNFFESNKNMMGGSYINEMNRRGLNTRKLIDRSFLKVADLSCLFFSQKEMHDICFGADLRIHRQMENSFAGDLRFLVCLFNILNYPLITQETITSPMQINVMKHQRKIPKNEYRLVDIDLPKPRGVKIYDQMFTGHGTPKRQHTRRGHWRRTKGLDGIVREKWIEEQIVGNPELGVITKDYNLRAK